MAFIDRVVEHPGRYTLTNSETGGVLGTFDFTRAEGTITTEGTQLNAANLNSELQSVASEVNENVSDAVSTALAPFTIDSSQNVKVRNLQRGSARVDAKKNKVVTKHVNFPKAFTSVPSVTITPITAAPNLVSFSVKSVTTKGFDLCLYRSSDTDTSFYWIAML